MATAVELMDERPVSPTSIERQKQVNAYFDVESLYWKDLYSGESGLLGEIIRDRQRSAIDCILNLGLPLTAHILEIGCGAGYMSIELANRGFSTTAIDASHDMVETAKGNVLDRGFAGQVTVEQGDVHNLRYADGSCDLVIAIGVLPWVPQPELAVTEVARVTKRGGYALFTTANLLELRNILDPWRYPFLRPLKLRMKEALIRSRVLRSTPSMRMMRPSMVDRQLMHAGLRPVESRTVGFGPFSLFGASYPAREGRDSTSQTPTTLR